MPASIIVIVLPALSADGKPGYDQNSAQFFACTPDQFPEMMAVALQKGDIHAWTSDAGIATVRSA